MKNIPYILLIIFFLVTPTVNGQTFVEHQKIQYQFEDSPSLVEVLSKLNDKSLIYWPSSILFEKNNLNLVNTRMSLLKKLEALDNQINDNASVQSIRRLAREISQWQLAKRLTMKIDYDLARTSNHFNPKLVQGEYILTAGARQKDIYIFGALLDSAPLKVNHQNHTLANEYIDNTWLSPLADRTHVIVIQADGRIQTVPTTSWNQQLVEIMPGSHIFIPFYQKPFDQELPNINQALISLAINRVLQ